MEAFFSPKDDQDEQGTGLYLVMGQVNRFFPELRARFSCNGSFVEIDPGAIIEGLTQPFPEEWSGHVKRRKDRGQAKPIRTTYRTYGHTPSSRRWSMRFPTDVPVKLVMLGTGGTGGHAAPHLYRMLHALNRPARFILCDGDLVEAKNLIRQNFAPADLGQNKARVLAERYASVFGMKAEYVPSFVETREELMRLIRPGIWEIKEGPYLYKLKREMVLLLGCVDNNKSRRLCHEAFCQSQDLVYIDSGNEEFSGQVVCGVRRNGRTIFKPVGGIAPEILKAQDRFPSEISCAEAAQADPQSMAANIMAATVMVDMVYNILAHGRSRVRVTEFSTQTAKMQTTLESAKRVAA